MARIEILTEERSLAEVLAIILPKILPQVWILNENYFIRPHEGKSDLAKSIPKKVKIFSNYYQPTGIIIIQDQDSNDCKILKAKLLNICQENGDCPILIRIICRELESWYLGDMKAIKSAYPHFKIEKYENQAKFRNPDKLNAADELKKILPEFQKIASAKAISPFLIRRIEHNNSESFQQFINGILKFFNQFENTFEKSNFS